MNVVIQQTNKTMMAHCQLLMELQRYAVAENIIGFESDY